MSSSESALGPLLRRHRAAAGLTQEDLAEKSGVSARTISDVERGLRSNVYRDTAERLASALGLPEEERSEFEQAARGLPRSVEAPLVRSAAIPAPPTRLIGREHELEIILDALKEPAIRLLTLTGPGGIGKTRIAIEAASRAQGAFRNGVFFVSLGSVADANLVLSVVAHALGLNTALTTPRGAIIGYLQDKQVLLVLDTFEHLLGAASSIGDLMAALAGLCVLVTSRETLHLQGEHEVAVPTLELPAEDENDLGAAPASALFLERARAIKPDLVIDEEGARAVSEICHRVNGLPLALELAAARVKHLPLPVLRDQLEHRLELLVGGSRDLPQRQQAMRDTVAWSYDLLDPQEQQLFAEVSLFAGGFTLDALAVVAMTKVDPLAGVSGLIDKSLVVLIDDREPRYSMLDVIHDYARDVVAQHPELIELEVRHTQYYLGLVEKAEPELGRATQQHWTHVLEREHDNVRAALRRAITREDADLALRLCGAAWQFWRSRGDLAEGRSWMREALAILPQGDAAIRAKALWGAAWLAYHQADYDDAEHLGDELLPVARAAGDPISIRNALTIQGMVAMARERYADAVGRFEEGLALLRKLDPMWLLATSLLNLGTAFVHTGQHQRARETLEEAIEEYRRLGDEHFRARATVQLGYDALVAGEAARARGLFSSGLRMFWNLQDRWGTTEALEGMATLLATEDRAAAAATAAGAAEAARETLTWQPLPWDHVVTVASLERTRSSIDEEAWRAAWEEGRGMSLARAVEFVLEK